MVQITVKCPLCGSEEIVKFGKAENDKQRYQCKNINCSCKTFILEYDYIGCMPDTENKIFQMAMNGSGIRDTSRVLQISVNTVINVLKKKNQRYKE
jgi:transposase-like protein